MYMQIGQGIVILMAVSLPYSLVLGTTKTRTATSQNLSILIK
jgi:hypothetical protein